MYRCLIDGLDGCFWGEGYTAITNFSIKLMGHNCIKLVEGSFREPAIPTLSQWKKDASSGLGVCILPPPVLSPTTNISAWMWVKIKGWQWRGIPKHCCLFFYPPPPVPGKCARKKQHGSSLSKYSLSYHFIVKHWGIVHMPLVHTQVPGTFQIMSRDACSSLAKIQ